MKKLLVLISVVASFAAYAQDSTAASNNVSEPVASAVNEPMVTGKSGAGKYPLFKRKGDALYNTRGYAEAIGFYEKARAIDNTDAELLQNLSECYRLTNNKKGMISAYGDLLKLGGVEPVYEIRYAEALVEDGRADEAKPIFEKYANDPKWKEHLLSYSRTDLYKKDADAYSVTAAAFNSKEADLCAVQFLDGVVFISTREKTDWIKRQHGWTDGNFCSVYYTDKKGKAPKIFSSDLKSKFNDGPLSFTGDFSRVFFTRNNSSKEELAPDGTYKLKVMEADIEYGTMVNVSILPFNNPNFNCAHPSISPDGKLLYFTSDMPGGFGGMDIYVCAFDSATQNWSAPMNLGPAVNTVENELFPFIAANGKFYFSSNGHDGLGGLDIYEATMKDGRAVKSYNMGEPVNSKDDDFGIYIGSDNKTGFISSNRNTGGMDDDVFELVINREVKRGKEVKIQVKDKESGAPLAGSKLVLNGDTVILNETGEYLTTAEEGTEYTVSVTMEDYIDGADNYNHESSPEETILREIKLAKNPKAFLRGLVTDARSGALLDGVHVRILDILTNTEIDDYTTTAAGDYFKFLTGKRIGDRLVYLIRLSKPGYLDRSIVFTQTLDKPGEINLNEKANLTLGKVEVGMDLAKMIDIKPIYFDLGKSNIRQDAAIELDKIVEIMEEYPNMYIELGSHTDCRGNAQANTKLSAARAKSSMTYIVKKGINPLRISSKGYGESRLLNNCGCEGKVQSKCTEKEHEMNRRTEFIITKLQ